MPTGVPGARAYLNLTAGAVTVEVVVDEAGADGLSRIRCSRLRWNTCQKSGCGEVLRYHPPLSPLVQVATSGGQRQYLSWAAS